MNSTNPENIKAIDHYEFLEILGYGGMSTVYKALDMQLQRPVALKLMHSHLADKPDFQERFLAEGRAIAALDHPNIIKVYEVALREGRLFLVMEYVEGGTLRSRLNAHLKIKEFLDLREIVSLTKQVAQALHYAHEEGIVHRDVKPDNVLLKAPGDFNGSTGFHAILSDFGLAKRIDGGGGGPMTATGELLGTLAYMAPEQFRGSITDARCDVYSLGVMLYELVSGTPPFGSASAVDMILMHTQGEPERIQDLRPDTPPALVSIIYRAMLKNPDDRYQTAGEIARELDALEKAIGSVTHPKTWRQVPTLDGGEFATLFDVLPALDRPPIPVDLLSEGGDDIIIVTPLDGPSWRMPFEKPSLTVGREKNCDLQLDDLHVSREHVRIDRLPDGKIIIADLGSLNGLYLGDTKLEKNTMADWPSSESVKVGPFWLTLRLAKSPVGIGRRIALNAPRPLEARLIGQEATLRISPSEAVVEPGSVVIARVEVTNYGQEDQYFHINIQGVEPDWFTVAPFLLYAPHNVRAERTVTFHPPRASSSTATSYEYAISLTPKDDERHTTTLTGVLHVVPYYEFKSDIKAGHKGFTLHITNLGNSQRHYVVEVREPLNKLVMLPSRVRTQIAPGQTAALDIKVIAKERTLIGRARHFPIEVFIRTDGLRPQTQSLEYPVPPRISWETVVVALLVLGLILVVLRQM
jgi:eukaryotic-like serine/threonine-protein kinase